MTVSTTTSAVTYTGNGVATNFSIPFEFKDDDQIVVTSIVISTLVGTVLNPSTYVLTGAGLAAPGNCAIAVPPTALVRIRIDRVTPLSQLVNFENNSGFLPEILEDQLDLTLMAIQELYQAVADAVSGGIVASIANAVVGAGVSVDGHFASFDGITGKILIDDGYSPASFSLAGHTHNFAALGSIPSTIAGYGITDLAATVAAYFTGGTHSGLTVSYDAGVPAINFTVASTNQWVDVIKDTTTTIATNTVLATDAQLQFPVQANTTYMIEGEIWIISNSVSGYKMGITGPAAPTLLRAFLSELDDGNTLTHFDVVAYSQMRNNTPGSTEITNLKFRATLENGVNAGTFGIQFAQNVSSATVFTVSKGSYLKYRAL